MTDRDRASISTASTPERGSTSERTSTETEVYTYTIPIPSKKDYTTTIKVPKLQWKSFVQKARELGFTANDLINQFINSIVGANVPITGRSAPVFNVAIAKAEAKPVINVGEYVAKKELDELVNKVSLLKARAERERQQCDSPLTFTVERAKVLESEIKKALRGVRSLPPEKLQEVEAALSILKSIKEGKA
ncbi:MAG: hypothetical protein QW491_08405 [Thermoproteota archaeon]